MLNGNSRGLGVRTASATTPQSPPFATTPTSNNDHKQHDATTTLPRTHSGGLPSGVLEGTLLYRRSSNQQTPTAYKAKMLKSSMRMYTACDLSDRVGLDFGSLRCYRFVGLSKKEANESYTSTKLGRDAGEEHDVHSPLSKQKKKQLCLEFPASLPWTVRDVENDTTAFIVEVPTSGYVMDDADWTGHVGEDAAATAAASGPPPESAGGGDHSQGHAPDRIDSAIDEKPSQESDDYEDDEDGVFNFWGDDSDDDDEHDINNALHEDTKESDTKESDTKPKQPTNQVRLDIARAASRNEPMIKYAFRCRHKKNEKALWLTAFGKIGRLSEKSDRTKGYFYSSTATNRHGNSRIRSKRAAGRAKVSLAMERHGMDRQAATLHGEDEEDEDQMREYRVRPSYAYPHRWMTNTELTEEMIVPSATVHDLRLNPGVGARRELGLLRVEVLQCLGLPGPKGIDPNAMVYLVCGSYAFSTDVIPSCKNPMWLSMMKRSCILPIYHGYARLYAGVFHDDGSKGSTKDTFMGRISVELARLKPGCTYDATIPLRQSTNVYSRRKQGAIRIRLTLDNFDTKGMVLSYLPNKRNRMAGQVATTVACGDPKSFRAIALTVHGRHLPGKFSTECLMATIREFTFVQKSVIRLINQFVQDLIVWRYPAVSLFSFLGWMHCVHAGTTTLVPVYVLGIITVQMMRNYARCIVGAKDFQPPTLEEILIALTDDTANKSTSDMHKPRGRIANDTQSGEELCPFHMLGLMKNDEYFVDGVDMRTQREFPFSSLAGYPRFHVEDALAGKSDLDADPEKDEENNADMFGDADDNQVSRHLSESDQAAYVPRLKVNTPFPEQNIDKKNPKSDKTLAEELQEVEEKVHKLTLHLFDDNRAYMITDNKTPPWGKRLTRHEKDGEEYDVKPVLDKLLGLGQYSQWNPIVSKFTVQIEPLVRVFETVLCAYRSLYNIFTWRDPFLSFWVSMCCIFAIIVLLLFPWRTTFFAIGVVGLGPQNFILRLVRESTLFKELKVRPGRVLRAFRELLKSDECNNDNKEAKKRRRRTSAANASNPQPVFHYQTANSRSNVEPDQTVGAQHIRIPYTPLHYHRLYDWPPDPKHSSVINEIPLDVSSLYTSKKNEIVTVRELPSPQKKDIQVPKTKEEELATPKEVSEVIKTPEAKVKEEKEVKDAAPTSLSSGSDLPIPTQSQTDNPNVHISQPETATETDASMAVTANNTTSGKVWSAFNNLNEAITKKAVNFNKDGACGDDTNQNGVKKLFMGRYKLNTSSPKSKKLSEDTASPAPSIAASDLSGNTSAGEKNTPDDEGSSPRLLDENSTPANDKPLTLGHKNEGMDEQTLVLLPTLEEEAQEKPSGVAQSANTLSSIKENARCESDLKPCKNAGNNKDDQLKHSECGKALHSQDSTSAAVEDLASQEQEHKTKTDDNANNQEIDTEEEGKIPSPRREPTLLLEELMAVKLQLAMAQTENDHYRRVLKENEEELDSYKNKCMQYEKHSFKLTSPFSKKK